MGWSVYFSSRGERVVFGGFSSLGCGRVGFGGFSSLGCGRVGFAWLGVGFKLYVGVSGSWFELLIRRQC